MSHSHRAALVSRHRRRNVSAATLFTHTFTAADSAVAIPAADTGEATQVLAGTWGISSNRAYLVASGGDSAVVWDAGASDGTFGVTFAAGATLDGIRFVFRASDASNYWIVQFASGFARLYKRVAGAFTEMGTAVAHAATDGDTVAVVLSGNDIAVTINGTPNRITATDAHNATATRVGIGSDATAVATKRWDTLVRTA